MRIHRSWNFWFLYYYLKRNVKTLHDIFILLFYSDKCYSRFSFKCSNVCFYTFHLYIRTNLCVFLHYVILSKIKLWLHRKIESSKIWRKWRIWDARSEFYFVHIVFFESRVKVSDEKVNICTKAFWSHMMLHSTSVLLITPCETLNRK